MPNSGETEGSPASAGATGAKEADTSAGVPLVTPPPAPPADQLDKAQREALRRRLRDRFH